MSTLKRFVFLLALAAIVVLSLQPAPVRADFGPKPSVNVEFTGFEGQTYFATLLSEEHSTGPSFAYEAGDYIPEPYLEDLPVFLAFAEYEDPDGFYFLGEMQESTDAHLYRWSYFPPDTFKVLLYFPDYDRFVSSEILETYAFDSYYSMDGTAIDLITAQGGAEGIVRSSYDWPRELLMLGIRIILTILVELGIAKLFGFRGRRVWRIIILVNIVTQILLNLALGYIQFQNGMWMFLFAYFALELLVIVIEAVLYALTLPQRSETRLSRAKAIGYAITANIVSLIVGLALAAVLPDIF